jgi:hypothetical protein
LWPKPKHFGHCVEGEKALYLETVTPCPAIFKPFFKQNSASFVVGTAKAIEPASLPCRPSGLNHLGSPTTLIGLKVAASSPKDSSPISSKARVETPWATSLYHEVSSKIVETGRLFKASSHEPRFTSKASAEIIAVVTVRIILFLGDFSTFTTPLTLIAALIAFRISNGLKSGIIAPFLIRATTCA